MDEMYGDRLAGIFGYSHLLGGFDGGQAEYVRVPLADNNLLQVPDHLKDEQVLFLSDIVCTGWHANELAEVSRGDTVCVWGLGPVGQMVCMWAKFRGASRVIGIDNLIDRLRLAESKGIETINFSEKDTVTTIKQMIPGGPDVVIEAVGFRFPKSLSHKVQRGIYSETDAPDILTECIKSVKLGGRMAVVGDYYSTANNFPIGALMEKGLTFRGSQVFVQKYWKELLGYIEQGKVDPTFVISHYMPLEKGDEAYKLFDKKETMKIILKTPFGTSMTTSPTSE
jgi:threonine dehydrogenase-like Zn-dependent dehydrogenase